MRPQGLSSRVAVVSLDFSPLDNALMADRLEQEGGLALRCGLHCAPMAHKTLGTYPQGTVRFSFGFLNTEEEVETAVRLIKNLLT